MKMRTKRRNCQLVEGVMKGSSMSKENYFRERTVTFKTEAERKKKKVDLLGNIRLICFVAGMALSILLFVKAGTTQGMVSSAIFLACFIYLVIEHRKVSAEMKQLFCMSDINNMYVDRMGTSWTTFEDNGSDFVDAGHPYTGDLDIFGPKSLYQWLCVSSTYYGRLFLKELLTEPDKSINAIMKRQEATKELVGKTDFCQKLQCAGRLSKGIADSPDSLLTYLEDNKYRFKKEWVQYIFYFIPALVILAFVLYALGSSVPLFVPLLLLAAQAVICAVGYSKNAETISRIHGLKRTLDAYSSLLDTAGREKFNSEYLSELNKALFIDELPAAAAIKKLQSIANAIDVRLSTVLYIILNFGLLWDYHCVFALEDWKKLYGRQIRKCLEAIGKIEAVSSLVVIGQIYPEWNYPVFSEDATKVIATDMGHPLIQHDLCVCNDFEINKGACIITGSNMSGKTTMLRTIGINLVLAYSGAPVFAGLFECSLMDIYTSMRISDDLNDGISTFYAELIRIKLIIDNSHKKKPMLYLIDEIFKGTNSPDRIAGAKSVLKNLNRPWIIGLISTHDFELCDMEGLKGVEIANYHFSENYENNEIKFDYKIRDGRSRTTNAKYLMRMVGIELTD